MLDIMQYVKPELMILAAVCYVLGMILKSSERVKDKTIPLTLGVFAVIAASIYIFGVSRPESVAQALECLFTGITQGVLCAGLAVYGDQIIKQSKKDE